MVYSPTAYGDASAADIRNILRTTAAEYGICLAVVVRIPPDAVDADYDLVVDQLAADVNARVVLIYVSEGYMQGLFDAVSRRTGPGWFLWLGGDAMSSYELYGFVDLLEGSIYTDLPWGYVPGFLPYFWSLAYGEVRMKL